MKRVEVRSNGTTFVELNSLNLDHNNVIGWVSNKYNPAYGWSIHHTTKSEKAEFGTDAVRLLSGSSIHHTTIVRLNLTTGTLSFIDNALYLEGKVSFGKATAYTKVIIDQQSDLIYLGQKEQANEANS